MASWILTFCTFLLSFICAERFFKSIWHGDLDQLAFQNLQGCNEPSVQANGHTAVSTRVPTSSASPEVPRMAVNGPKNYTTDNSTKLATSRKTQSLRLQLKHSTSIDESNKLPSLKDSKRHSPPESVSANPILNFRSKSVVLTNLNAKGMDKVSRPPPMLQSKSLSCPTSSQKTASASAQYFVPESSSITESLDRWNCTPDPLITSSASQRPLLTPKVWTGESGPLSLTTSKRTWRKGLQTQHSMSCDDHEYNEVVTSEGVELISTV